MTAPLAETFPIPEYAPAEWFEMPSEDELAPGQGLTITDDGRVFGYFWEGDSCMLGLPGWPDVCTAPTHSPTNYAAFHQQDYVTADGETIRVGAIGNVGGHASPYASVSVAQKVYADPEAQRIVARAYDVPGKGALIAGVLVPGLTYGDVAQLRRSALSGDWRPMEDAWFKRNEVPAQAAAAVQFYDCIGPTLVTRPGLPLVKAYRSARTAAAPPVILGGLGGVQLADGEGVPYMEPETIEIEIPDGADPETITAAVEDALAARTAAPGPVVAGGGAADTQNPDGSQPGSIEERVGMIERFLTEVVGPFIQDSQNGEAAVRTAAVLAEIDATRIDLPGEEPIPLPAAV